MVEKSIQRITQPMLPDTLLQAGEAANQAAARHRFADYQSRRAAETLRRQGADVGLFAAFLEELGITTGNLLEDPEAWRGITWGLVEAFVKWQLQKGYALPSINIRLSTLKTYSRLAMQAGTISPQEYALIRAIQGYSRREQRRLDARRPVKRIGLKKEEPVKITPEQARALKSQPEDTPQGRRDALLMCLLLDHGLRVGEVAILQTENLDLDAGMLRFFRPKVGKAQTHRLSPDTLKAAKAYRQSGDALRDGPLLRRSHKDAQLGKSGMTTRAITLRVSVLGEQIGIAGLSAHDCRHYWATSAARAGTDPFSLQEAGGWSSLAMPRRYVEDQDVANEGIKTGEPSS